MTAAIDSSRLWRSFWLLSFAFSLTGAIPLRAADLTISRSGSSGQAIGIYLLTRHTEGSNLVGTLHIENLSGTWAYIERDVTSSVALPYTDYLLGPGAIKQIPNFVFPKGANLNLKVTTPVGMFDWPAFDPRRIALENAFIVDLITRGLLNFNLPPDFFDQGYFGVIGGARWEVFDTLVSSEWWGALGVAARDRDVVGVAAALQDLAADSKRVKSALFELLKKKATEKQIEACLNNIVQIVDLPEKKRLLVELHKSTQSAEPTSWLRLEVVARSIPETVTSVTPTTLTTQAIAQTQTLTIHGSGFTGSSKLLFTHAGNVFSSVPNRTRFVDSNTLEYDIAVGSAVGQWTVATAEGNAAVNFEVIANPPALFTITPSSGAHGSIVPAAPFKQTEGETVTLYATPENSSFVVDTWYVDGVAIPGTGTQFTLADIQKSQSILVTFKAVDPAPPNQDDHGDSSAFATTLTSGTAAQGLISSPSDVDWFKVVAAHPGTLAFHLSVPTGKDYDLELFGPDGSFIKGSYGASGAADSIAYSALAAGSYYVRVYGYPIGNGGFSLADTYRISCTLPLMSPAAGTVITWGANSSGQRIVPVGLTGVSAIAAGLEHTLALRDDGTVVAWGDNAYGQATVPSGLANVKAIAAGSRHNLALKADGTVVAWGYNQNGQTNLPAGLSGVVAIAAGGSRFGGYSIALKGDGTIVAWGDNGGAAAALPPNLGGMVAIAAGGYDSIAGGFHAAGLRNDGTVVVWGSNVYGQASVPAGLSGVVAIAAGGRHTVALKSDGTVVAWGWNFDGQTTVPAGLNGVVAIAAGFAHTLALKNDGTIVAWGRNFDAQTITPAGLGGVAAIAAGGSHNVALAGNSVGVFPWTIPISSIAQSVRVSVSAFGAWTASENLDWVSLSPGLGSGSGTVVVAVAENTSLYPRSGVIEVGGKTYTIVQRGKSATNLDAWDWRNPTPQGNSLVRITWGLNQFVAVGGNGTILTSPDGRTWSTRTSGTGNMLNAVTWNGVQYVTVGAFGTILTSPDGIQWTTCATNAENTVLYDVVWSGREFVAVGTSATILTSPNGITWTARDSGSSTYFTFYGIASSGSQLVAVGKDGRIVTSVDGINWTVRPPIATDVALFGVTWNGSRFVAVGTGGAIWSSPDGIAWTAQVSGTTTYIYHVLWTGNLFLASLGDGSFLTSPDGNTWTPRASGVAWLADSAWNGSEFAAVGYFGVIATSPDALTWVSRSGGTRNDIYSIVGNGKQMVAVGIDGTIVTSPDGRIWAPRLSGTTNWLQSVTWGGNQFVAVGAAGKILTSHDGNTWTTRTSDTTTQLGCVTWNGTQFLALGASGWSVSSRDGITWTKHPSGTSLFLSSVVWSGTQFVAVGASGIIRTSADGLNWTTRNSGTLASLTGIASDGKQMVVVGAGGTILTSTDTITWVARSSGTTSLLIHVGWDGSQFVAVGMYGTIFSSPDGVTWSARNSGASANLRSGVATASGYLVVGDYGTILSSGTPLAPTITPQRQNISALGGRYIANMASDESWTVDDTLTWVTISASAGTGNASLIVTVNENPSLEPRTGVITIGGQPHTIVQDGIVANAPTITVQPSSRTANFGESVSFTVRASGSPAPTYQWQRKAAHTGHFVNLGNNDVYSGTGTATLTIGSVVGAMNGDQFRCVASNGVDPAGTSDAVVLSVIAPADFDSWRLSKFSTEEMADLSISGPNGVYGTDGITNLVKYALGLDPKQNATDSLPFLRLLVGDWIYTYDRPSNRSDIFYVVEISTDLSSWTTLGVTHERIAEGPVETWQARYPLNSSSTVFFRLRVSN